MVPRCQLVNVNRYLVTITKLSVGMTIRAIYPGDVLGSIDRRESLPKSFIEKHLRGCNTNKNKQSCFVDFRARRGSSRRKESKNTEIDATGPLFWKTSKFDVFWWKTDGEGELPFLRVCVV